MLALKLLLPFALFAASYQPEALDSVKRLARSAHGCGVQPVVVFDLDDTLINTRERTLRILKEFMTSVESRYPLEVRKLAGLSPGEIRYVLRDTFRARGVLNEAFLKEAGAFWTPRFFSNEYVLDDKPNPGASAYVQSLAKEGARIVYLTGRDIPNMQNGTVANLRGLDFPEGILLMKPDPKMDDLAFKRTAIAQIKEMGSIVGVFENEPANLNLLHEAFPAALAIFLDTIHSPKPDQPFTGSAWVGNFLAPKRVSPRAQSLSQ